MHTCMQLHARGVMNFKRRRYVLQEKEQLPDVVQATAGSLGCIAGASAAG